MAEEMPVYPIDPGLEARSIVLGDAPGIASIENGSDFIANLLIDAQQSHRWANDTFRFEVGGLFEVSGMRDKFSTNGQKELVDLVSNLSRKICEFGHIGISTGVAIRKGRCRRALPF